MSALASILILGSGHAGIQAAAALREAGFSGRVTVFGADPELPYHKPPLSKEVLRSGERIPLRGEGFYAAQGIELRLGEPVERIDREYKCLVLESGEPVPYGHLILATGAVNRRLDLLGRPAKNAFHLRDARDAMALKPALELGRDLLVIGGGFVGLEVAATARQCGLSVRVLEAGPRLLSRALSPALSQIVCDLHCAAGVDITSSTQLAGLERDAKSTRIVRALLPDGSALPVDILLVAIGALPEVALARAAGLEVDNGIIVDSSLRSSDPDISAIGDCASFPCGLFAERLRLESVQNAGDQARHVAARLMGSTAPYRALPTFWSQQFDARIQIAGLPALADRFLRRSVSDAQHVIIGLQADRVVSVETVNAPKQHVLARRHIAMRGLTGFEELPTLLKEEIGESAV